MADEDETEEPEPQQGAYPTFRPTFYGVRFGSPGNLAPPRFEAPRSPLLPIALSVIGVVLLVVLAVIALVVIA